MMKRKDRDGVVWRGTVKVEDGKGEGSRSCCMAGYRRRPVFLKKV